MVEYDRALSLLQHLVHLFIPVDSLRLRIEHGQLAYKDTSTMIVLIVDLSEDVLSKASLADWAFN